MENAIRIRLLPNQHPELWVRDGARRQHFFTTFSALVDLFNASKEGFYREQAPWHATPILPPGACYYADNGQESWTVLDLPPTRHAMALETNGLEVFPVPLPRALFAIHRRGDRVLHGALRLTTTSGPLTAETPLAHYPLANVYPNGTLCWTPPDVPWPPDRLPELVRGYFATPHNFHLFDPARNQPGFDLRHLLMQLTEQETFPADWLVPAESFGAWLGHLHA